MIDKIIIFLIASDMYCVSSVLWSLELYLQLHLPAFALEQNKIIQYDKKILTVSLKLKDLNMWEKPKNQR